MPRTGNTLKRDTAREYRKKYGMKMPSRALAKIMFQDNKLLFRDLEDARYVIRSIEGKTGKKEKRMLGVMAAGFVMDEPRPINPYKFPESDESKYEPYILKGYKRIAVLSDFHIPFHSIAALTAAFDFCKKEKPDLILLDGDIIDCHLLSRFIKDPKKRSFPQELDAFAAMIQVIEKTFKCKILFKKGNHSERYEHYLWTHAPALAGIKEIEFENIIKARANGIEIVGDKRIIKAGSLNIIHGHEFANGFFNPVNVARGLFLRGKTSALQGHSHQTSEHTENDMNGKITTTWSIGCLCELHPQFMPINKWNHGFAIVDMDGDNFDVRNKRIYKGKVL